jgi:RNA polymerase sigma factor (sigma-70 family)
MKHKTTVVRKLIRQRLCTDLEAEDFFMVAAGRSLKYESSLTRNRGKQKKWLQRTAGNLALDAYRKRKRAEEEFEFVDRDVDERLRCDGPGTRLAVDRLRRRFGAVWDSLTPNQQTCLMLRYEDGMKISDIVRQTGLPRWKVKQELARAAARYNEMKQFYKDWLHIKASGH